MSERIYLGAEAEILRDSFLGGDVVAKRRRPKAYRHPALDARIRRDRTRLEAQILAEVRAAGVDAPAVLDVDVDDAALRLSPAGGRRLKDLLDEEPGRAPTLCRAFGRLVGRLHAAGYVHGDLTTSNVHAEGERLVLLDFGLAQRSADVEDQGVDLHLVERTFESTHAALAGAFAAFLDGYRETFAPARLVERRMEEIKSRARYA